MKQPGRFLDACCRRGSTLFQWSHYGCVFLSVLLFTAAVGLGLWDSVVWLSGMDWWTTTFMGSILLSAGAVGVTVMAVASRHLRDWIRPEETKRR